MKKCLLFPAVLIFIMTANAQRSKDADASANPKPAMPNDLFESDRLLDMKLSGNVRELLNDRTDKSTYHHLSITYLAEDSSEVTIPIEAKTRGHFRRMRGNCQYPPLLLRFSKTNTDKSIFKNSYRLKLVMPCRGDEYIVREWLAYKLYNLVTPKSFRARLVRVKIDDHKNKQTASLFFGMLLEEEQQVARRNDLISVTRKLRPEQTDTGSFLTMAVFEYLIGNTDWSVQYLQNIKLLATDSNAVPVPIPYDFDMSALVGSPYAKPAEELNLSSVRERRYRGYCIQDMKQFDDAISLFNRLKPDIYALYTKCALIDARYLKTTLKFFDEFYATINSQAELKKAFEYPCDKNGTGNVVIKGLRED